MKYEPHDYQKYSVEYIKSHPIAAILLSMGLGKTSITLTAINDLMFDSFEVHKVLCICPLRVATSTWGAEIGKWEHLHLLKYSVAVGTEAERLDALKAQLEQAERTYNMQKELFDDKVISRNEFNVADASYKTAKANYNAATQGIKGGQANVQTARASLQKAQKDLGRTIIVAPSDGVISLLNVKKGEKVAGNSFNVGTEMMRIADMNKIEVRVDVPENDIVKVQLGDTALIEVEAYSNRKFKGIVTKIASSNNGAATSGLTASNDVTQYKVNILLIAESYMDLIGKGSFPFRPGMSASADIQTETHANVLSVPINAVTTRDKNDSSKTEKKKIDASDAKAVAAAEDDLEVVVFVLNKDNTLKKVKVKTAIQDINNIEITEGLSKDEMVITGPYDVVSKTLKVGDRVKVVDKKELFDKN